MGPKEKQEDFYHVHRRPSHTFPLLHGYQQVPHTGIPGSVGQKKGHPYSGDRGFYTPIMERRIKRKIITTRPTGGLH